MSLQFKTIGMASDHAGKDLKHVLVDFLRVSEIEVVDYGVNVDVESAVDYPDYASLVAKDLGAKKIDAGILVCGTGIGMAIAANKYKGIRAVVGWDEFTTRLSRAHNDANILCLGGRVLHPHRAIEIVKVWLETPFSNGHHSTRIEKIAAIEKTLHSPR